jgi:hypothetical protein
LVRSFYLLNNRDGNINIVFESASWLRMKYDQALNRRDAEKDVITELLQIPNPHTSGHQSYSIQFFRVQWADQVRVALEQEKEEEVTGKENLARFFENEEILNSYR